MIEIQFDLGTAQDIMNGELTGQIKTRDGKSVRIICTDAKGPLPIVGLIDMGDTEFGMKYTLDGKVNVHSNVRTPSDLVIDVEGGEE
jgi:hypothetical protein